MKVFDQPLGYLSNLCECTHHLLCSEWLPVVENVPRSILKLGIFMFAQCVGTLQLVSRFLSEEIPLCIAIDSVCPWQDKNSRGSDVAILDWNLWKFKSFCLMLCIFFHVMWYSLGGFPQPGNLSLLILGNFLKLILTLIFLCFVFSALSLSKPLFVQILDYPLSDHFLIFSHCFLLFFFKLS